MKRRTVIHAAAGSVVLARARASIAASPDKGELTGEVGVTTGGFIRHLSVESHAGKMRLLDLPKLLRDELDMRVIDLMTKTLASMAPAYLEQLRHAAASAGCVLTNLKMNQPGLDMASPDEATRRHALNEFKNTIDAAAMLGVRWVRPQPGIRRPDPGLHAAAYRELIDYAAPKGIALLIENNGWLRDDPAAIPSVIQEVGAGLHAQPDTGNWTDAARFDGLARAFPLAVTCDFKAFELAPDGGHQAYDLKRCFQIGWDSGFRGPWCIEHAHADWKQHLRETALLRDQLRQWMKTP
jgi:hypothetical protein